MEIYTSVIYNNAVGKRGDICLPSETTGIPMIKSYSVNKSCKNGLKFLLICYIRERHCVSRRWEIILPQLT